MRRKASAILVASALAGLLLVACGGKGDSKGQTDPAGESSSAAPPSPIASVMPKPVSTIRQGGTYWAVYISADKKADDPDMKIAKANLANLKVKRGWSSGQISCDKGAAEALGVPDSFFAVAVYFDTEEEARAFPNFLATPIVDIAQVKTFCAD